MNLHHIAGTSIKKPQVVCQVAQIISDGMVNPINAAFDGAMQNRFVSLRERRKFFRRARAERTQAKGLCGDRNRRITGQQRKSGMLAFAFCLMFQVGLLDTRQVSLGYVGVRDNRAIQYSVAQGSYAHHKPEIALVTGTEIFHLKKVTRAIENLENPGKCRQGFLGEFALRTPARFKIIGADAGMSERRVAIGTGKLLPSAIDLDEIPLLINDGDMMRKRIKYNRTVKHNHGGWIGLQVDSVTCQNFLLVRKWSKRILMIFITLSIGEWKKHIKVARHASAWYNCVRWGCMASTRRA